MTKCTLSTYTTYFVLVYHNDEGRPWTLPVVRKVEKILAADETISKEYGPPFGQKEFHEAATKLLLGADSPAILENRVSIFMKYMFHRPK